jgi:hypothetical protein
VVDAGDGEQEELVTYTDDAQPVLQQFCGDCHAAPNMAGGHSAASSYDDAVRVSDDMLVELNSGGMPPNCGGGDPGDPNCISVEGLAVIQQWVDDGTLE